MTSDLSVAEVPYESGVIRFRYSRILSADGTQWVRHGLFVERHENGNVISEGTYLHGQKQGWWRLFHANGQLAAQGRYNSGREEGLWRFWNSRGDEEAPVKYQNGTEVA
jgi:antitoxin component YwqK of YwqJK toxin-antitoxin module